MQAKSIYHILSLCLFLCVSAAAFLTQTVCLDDTTVKFEIWDTAGQERYHSLAPMYYRGAQAAIVVYDITNTVREHTQTHTNYIVMCLNELTISCEQKCWFPRQGRSLIQYVS